MKKINLIKKVIVAVLLCVIMQNANLTYANTNLYQTEAQDNNGNIYGNNNSIATLNTESVSRFVDEYFQTNMEKWHVPGVAVAIVKDNKELYKAGYGFSNIETKSSVDPDTTTFPAASVSKLFTATAIMQLYQEGKLDLNENIQTYLDDIVINNPYKEKISCQNLLTHSSGLDEQSELDGSTLDIENLKSQKEYFQEHKPNVIIKPNTVCRYSNMGYNLLGYTVEKISKKSYENYITDNILKPLQMVHSSVRIANESMAKGYEFSDNKHQKVPFAYQYTSRSSGIITTVTDMENFMIMHLNNGSFQNNPVLNPDSEQLMQNKQFSNAEVFDGMGYGFIRASRNGVQLLKHEGALPGYTTTLILIPSQKFGIYVATNSLSGIVFDFEEAFLDYFLGACKSIKNDENSSSDINEYIGTYRSYDGVSERNISKLFTALDDTAQLDVTKSSDGKLKVRYYEQNKKMVETNLIYKSEGIFLREDGKGYITFRENSNGNIEYAFNYISHQTYKKIGKMETITSISILLLFSLLVLSISFIIVLIKRIRHKQKDNKTLWLLNCFVNFIYILGFLGVLGLEIYMILNYDYRFINALFILLTLLMVAITLNVYGIICMIYGIIKKKFNRPTTIKLIIVQTVQILFVIVLGYFNLIGYHIF